MFKKYLKKSMAASQHCQRNWDLTKEISDEDMEVIEAALTQAPSKQNQVFFRAVIITDRDMLEKIHSYTDGFMTNFTTRETTTNPQVLANAVIAFVRDTDDEIRTTEDYDGKPRKQVDEDRSVGVAAGFVTLAAEMIGLKSGCCQCFTSGVDDIVGGKVLLMMGIGHGDQSRSRLEHHADPSFRFPSKSKKVKVEYV